VVVGTSAHDEYTYCKQATPSDITRLKRFRDTFISKRDFVWLREQGIEAVRIPVGFWLFGESAPYIETVSYLDAAFRWAEQTGLRILIDLHGAPGSQNGRDHSGHSGRTGWHQASNNRTKSLSFIEALATRYGNKPALLGISLLNEPSPFIPKHVLLDFYKASYAIIRRLCGNTAWIVYSDGYIPLRWHKELPIKDFPGVIIDAHHYQIYTPLDKILPPALNILRARWQLPWKLHRLSKYHQVIVGEWSATLSERTLQGYSHSKRQDIARTYAEQQLSAYRTAAGWFFWTYKTESGGTWSFTDCIKSQTIELDQQ
jgi:glucan 1,3-beta-glucosidase